jgi:(1->4)-alpha-D-glucan 1-alpha-D-glucosylmutase
VLLPYAGDIAMLLQTITGAWPLDLDMADQKGRRAFADRLARWQEKALREAKLATDWSVPNEAYESAARHLTKSVVADNALPDLLKDFAAFAERISAAGAVNGLAQTFLKLTVPGVPDFYQGTEFWDFSLVDPDNRSRVDFDARVAAVGAASPEALVSTWRDGRIKQALILRTLALRSAAPALFADGTYEPLKVQGAFADRVIAFARRLNDDVLVVVAPRIASQLLRTERDILFEEAAWKNTFVELGGQKLVNLFAPAEPSAGTVKLGSVLSAFPVALLISPALKAALDAVHTNAAAHTTLR